ncbi:bzip family transcription factor [Phaffia rhodozyma]|uniref:Bzip family transcription factor n=1 Tax=Phaffia rhodozyma TaxID=264483 RepID=A0A0F7SMT9_PHARH|nr:bzip family transcription factor [Phaffia rhodozyma]
MNGSVNLSTEWDSQTEYADILSFLDKNTLPVSSSSLNTDDLSYYSAVFNPPTSHSFPPQMANRSASDSTKDSSFQDDDASSEDLSSDDQDSHTVHDGDHKRKGSTKQSGATGKKGKKAESAVEEESTKKGTKKKNSAEGKDEGKLSKRKEQNRAAQRAFRERKERRVKDLEDQVAALAAMSEGQKSENENLRDLLSRLQSENVRLRQQAFTFSVPKAGGPNALPFNSSKPLSPPTSIKSAQTSSSNSGRSISSPSLSPANHSTGPSPSSTLEHDPSSVEHPRTMSTASLSSSDSPDSVFNSIVGPDTPPLIPAFSSSGFNAFASSDIQDPDIARRLSEGTRIGSQASISQQQLQQPKPVWSHSSNDPLTTSPSDIQPQLQQGEPPVFAFSPSDFFSPSGEPAGISLPTPSSEVIPTLPIRLASPIPFQTLATNPLFTSYRSPAEGSYLPGPSFMSNVSGLPDLFGGQGFEDFLSFSQPTFGEPPAPAFTPNTASMLDSLISNSSSDSSPASLAHTSQSQQPSSQKASDIQALDRGISSSPLGLSPESSLSPEPTSNTSATVATSTKDRSECSEKCLLPGQNVVAVGRSFDLRSSTVSTDDDDEEPDNEIEPEGTADEDTLALPGLEAIENIPWKEKSKFFRGRILVAADPTAKNYKLDEVWDKIRAAPGFTPDFDLDGLCHEMKSKAKCDGTGPVLDESQLKQIMEEIPFRQKKQNSMFGSMGEYPGP